MIAMGSPVARLVAVLLVFLVIGIAASVWRGDSPATTAAQALVGVICGGFIVGCYWWVRRKD